MCLYIYHVDGLKIYSERLKASQAKDITDLVHNEFWEKSLSFVAPDGYFWTLLEGS
jgi:hypothetical protein